MSEESANGPRGRAAEWPTDIPVTGWKDIALRVKNQVRSDHISLSAAGVAFFGFLALVPALAATLGIYGLIADPDSAGQQMQDLSGALPDKTRALLVEQVRSVASSSGGALSFTVVVGLALAVWSASSGVAHLVEAINIAYDGDDRGSMVKRCGLALLMTVGAAVGAVITLAAITIVPTVLADSAPAGLRWLLSAAIWLLVGAAFVAGLSVLYRVGPHREAAKWRWVTTGSAVALVMWLLASIGFSVYARNFGSFNETYGSLSAMVILQVWLFLTAFAILVGAEVNAEMEHQTKRDTTTGPNQRLGTRGAYVADDVGASADEATQAD